MEARMVAYKMSSWPNDWNQDTLPEGCFLTKKTVRQVLITLCRIHMVWRCCVMKFRWLTWVQGMKNSWIHHCCGDDHGCRWFFMMTVDALFGDNSVYSHDTQNRTMSCHFLMMPPWCDFDGICWSLMLKECIRLQMGGPSIIWFDFFQFGTWQVLAVCQWIQHFKKVE